MKSLRKLRALSSPQRTILLEAALLLMLVRLCLPFGGLLRTLRFLRRAEPLLARPQGLSAQQISGMVMCAARRCPFGSTCLTRALTANLLLVSSGLESRLCIGAGRNEQGNFEAHAWLESNRQVILGGTEEDVSRFRKFDGVDDLIV